MGRTAYGTSYPSVLSPKGSATISEHRKSNTARVYAKVDLAGLHQ
jgi:hypothetical protein